MLCNPGACHRAQTSDRWPGSSNVEETHILTAMCQPVMRSLYACLCILQSIPVCRPLTGPPSAADQQLQVFEVGRDLQLLYVLPNVARTSE